MQNVARVLNVELEQLQNWDQVRDVALSLLVISVILQDVLHVLQVDHAEGELN